MHIRHDDNRLTWGGAVSIEHRTDYTQPWRIDYRQAALFPPAEMQSHVAISTGVRLSFYSDARAIAGSVVPIPVAKPIDLCIDGKFVTSAPLDDLDTFRFENLPAHDKLVELWLPQRSPFRLKGLELSDAASLRPFDDRRCKWITYGSSITQCGSADRPTNAWPSLVAREKNLNLTCLGFGGQCHLDPMLARMIRDLPADYLSLSAGINIYGKASLGPRAFLPALIGFIQIVREKHQSTPLAVISPIFSPARETTPNAVGFTLQLMRAEVENAVKLLKDAGDRHIHYFNGLDLFGSDLAHMLPDQLHPNTGGYRIIADRFLERIAGPLFN